MKAHALAPTRNDKYLVHKFGALQEAARFAQTEISAIPDAVGPVEEQETIRWVIAPVERLAERLAFTLRVGPVTRMNAQMMKRVMAWLDGDGLDCLLEPMEVAA